MRIGKTIPKNRSLKTLFIIFGIIVAVLAIVLSTFLIIRGIVENHKENSLLKFYGIEFNDATYRYDGRNKKIYIENQPEFSTVTYSCTLDDGTIVNRNYFSEPGTYKIDAKVEKENYKTVTVSATLKIVRAFKINFHINKSTIIPLEVFEGEKLDYSLIPDLERVPGKNARWSVSDFDNITKDIDVYPIYEDVLYRVTYVLNGGTIDGNYIESFYANELEFGPLSLPIPIREGYYFDGWYIDDSYEYVVDCISFAIDYVLYAHWKKEDNSLEFRIINDHAVVVGIDKDYDGNCNSIIIPDEYNGYKVTEILPNAFAFNSDILYVTIGANVWKIGDNAFKSCGKLRKVEMSDNVEETGNNCFANCFTLESVKLSENISVISEKMFNYCESLQEIILPAGVNTICEGAFANCRKLERILYEGRSADFERLTILDESDIIIYIYEEDFDYSSDEKYWCYNENGEIVTN